MKVKPASRSADAVVERVVLVISAAIRLAIYVGFVANTWGGPAVRSIDERRYGYALSEHFLQYVWRNIVLPPLPRIINAVPIWVFGPETTARFHLFLLIVFLLDCGAMVLLFRTMRALRVRSFVAGALSSLYSVSIVTLDMWRAGGLSDRYDRYTAFFSVLFLYWAVRAAQAPRRREMIGLAVSSALFILQLPAAFYVVPLSLIVIGIVTRAASPPAVGEAHRWRVVAATVAVTASALVGRNYAVAGLLTSSTEGGAALMMFTQTGMGWAGGDANRREIRNLVVESGAPDWYLWCFDNPQNPLKPGERFYEQWFFMATSLGTCLPWAADPEDRPWPFDVDPLMRKMFELNQPGLVKLLRRDREDTLNRQYLFSGFSPEVSMRWTAAYGAVSTRVALHFLLTRPAQYFATIRKVHYHYGVLGPWFLGESNVLKTVDYPLSEYIFEFNKRITGPILRAFYRPILLLTPVLAVGFLLGLAGSRRSRLATLGPRIGLYLVVLTPAFLLSVLYSSTVTDENERYFLQIIPFLLSFGGMLISDAFTVSVGWRRREAERAVGTIRL